MNRGHRSRSVQVPSPMAKNIFHHRSHQDKDDDDDDDDEIVEELIEEVVIFEEDPSNPNHPHNPDPTSAYISGVGDLSCSVRRVEFRQHAFDKMKQEEVIEYVIDHAGNVEDPHHTHHRHDSEQDPVVLLQEVDEEDNNTEVEYYEDSEIEEIELDDDDYEEIILPEDALASLNISAAPPESNNKRATAAHATSAAASPNDTELTEHDTTHHEDPPCREDVIEAITYIVRQEKVVEYGLMSKNQVDEMNALPLEELCEIMKHFEICDNNNATIQWELVLAMINPDYANLEEAVDNESDHGEE